MTKNIYRGMVFIMEKSICDYAVQQDRSSLCFLSHNQ